MSSDVPAASRPEGVTICFGERFAQSEQFDAVFRQGMELVERTADYLDGRGRTESRGLKPPLSVSYATESMRLTTRLLELASWLLVQRSVRDGEMTREEALLKRDQIKLRTFGRPQSIKNFSELPVGLRDLIEESTALMERIARIDSAMRSGDAEVVSAPTPNAVNSLMASLQAAFSPAQR